MLYLKFIPIVLAVTLFACESEDDHATTTVNLRRSPSSKSKSNILRVLQPSEALAVVKEDRRWTKVRVLATGETGWVFGKYLNSNSVKDVNFVGMILSAILSTFFGYFVTAIVLSSSSEGERISPSLANSIVSGMLVSFFLIADSIRQVNGWKVAASYAASYVVASIADKILLDDDYSFAQTLWMHLLGIVGGILTCMVFYYAGATAFKSSRMFFMFMNLVFQLQSSLSFFN